MIAESPVLEVFSVRTRWIVPTEVTMVVGPGEGLAGVGIMERNGTRGWTNRQLGDNGRCRQQSTLVPF